MQKWYVFFKKRMERFCLKPTMGYIFCRKVVFQDFQKSMHIWIHNICGLFPKSQKIDCHFLKAYKNISNPLHLFGSGLHKILAKVNSCFWVCFQLWEPNYVNTQIVWPLWQFWKTCCCLLILGFLIISASIGWRLYFHYDLTR